MGREEVLGWGRDSWAESENEGLWKTPGWGGTGPEELENSRLGKLAGQRESWGHQTGQNIGGGGGGRRTLG